MTDRRTFIQSTGATDAQFAGYQLLKLLSYSPNNTSSLQPGQQLSAGGLIGEFAADQADNIDTNRFGFSVENPAAGYDAAAATLADWTFVSHQQLAGGLTALTVRDTSGAYWVVFDGVDSAGGLVETPFDMMEALNIVLSVGYDPHGSTQFDAATAYLHDLQQTLSPGAKINGIGQSLGGAVLKALALSNPGAFGSVIALDSPGLNNGWVARLESEYRAIASSGIAVDLPFIFEYGLGADFIRGWRSVRWLISMLICKVHSAEEPVAAIPPTSRISLQRSLQILSSRTSILGSLNRRCSHNHPAGLRSLAKS